MDGRSHLRRTAIPSPSAESVGFVDCNTGLLPTAPVGRADRAHYLAKDNGRHQVVDFADMAAADGDDGGTVKRL